jgi:hypothetical protein
MNFDRKPRPPLYSEGDKVTIIGKCWGSKGNYADMGKTVTVSMVLGGDGIPYRYHSKEGAAEGIRNGVYEATSLTLATKFSADPANTFKIGDKVRVVGPSWMKITHFDERSTYPIQGSTFVIDTIQGKAPKERYSGERYTTLPVGSKRENNRRATHIFTAASLELVKDEDYKVGDKVEIFGYSINWDGPATVKSASANTVTVHSETYGESGGFRREHIRRPIENNTNTSNHKENNMSAIQNGDRVQVVVLHGTEAKYNGVVGTAESVTYSYNEAYVRFDTVQPGGYVGRWFKLNQLRKAADLTDFQAGDIVNGTLGGGEATFLRYETSTDGRRRVAVVQAHRSGVEERWGLASPGAVVLVRRASEALSLKEKVFNHLTSADGTTGDRQKCLADLTAKGVFYPGKTDEQVAAIVNDYLTLNPQRFCQAGIDRFRRATGIEVPKPKRATVRIVLDVVVESTDGNPFTDKPNSSQDRKVAMDVAEALVGKDLSKTKVISTDYKSFAINPTGVAPRLRP